MSLFRVAIRFRPGKDARLGGNSEIGSWFIVSGIRELLAALSALCGLTLLTFAARGVLRRRTPGRSRSLALGLYGLLFVFAAVVLWTRGETRKIPQPMPRPPEVTATEPTRPGDSGRTADRPLRSEETRASGVNSENDSLNFHPLPEPRVTVRERSELTREESRLRAAGKKPAARNPAIARVAPASSDEQVRVAVLRAFDAVERWFMRHGSPAPGAANSNTKAGPERQWELPEVMFLDDTAELTAEGVHRLRQLAGRLQSLADSGVIEIHARTSDFDPTPFHFILTQARAEVVRDFLMNEGVRNHRLITKAMSSEGEDSTMARPQVRLVFRP
jgi:outer membrane protein OmpA-like peptidoglycan-associated protein